MVVTGPVWLMRIGLPGVLVTVLSGTIAPRPQLPQFAGELLAIHCNSASPGGWHQGPASARHARNTCTATGWLHAIGTNPVAEIEWGQTGRASYDRTHAEL
jgi:hypothetical protein